MTFTSSKPAFHRLALIGELKSLQTVTFRLSHSRNGIAYLGPTISNIPLQSFKLETGMKTLAIQSIPYLSSKTPVVIVTKIASCCKAITTVSP